MFFYFLKGWIKADSRIISPLESDNSLEYISEMDFWYAVSDEERYTTNETATYW